jgi:hypothetical protein
MAYSVQLGTIGRYIITHPKHPGLAWSGSGWVQHSGGLPAAGIKVCNFETEDEADEYATEYFLYPRVD